MKKRFLSILLALSMFISILPTNIAFAAGSPISGDITVETDDNGNVTGFKFTPLDNDYCAPSSEWTYVVYVALGYTLAAEDDEDDENIVEGELTYDVDGFDSTLSARNLAKTSDIIIESATIKYDDDESLRPGEEYSVTLSETFSAEALNELIDPTEIGLVWSYYDKEENKITSLSDPIPVVIKLFSNVHSADVAELDTSTSDDEGPTKITGGKITVTPPAAGETPDLNTASISGTGFKVKAVEGNNANWLSTDGSWDASSDKFGYSTKYTVSVALEPVDENYEFKDSYGDSDWQVGDGTDFANATRVSLDGGVLTVTFQFPATEAAATGTTVTAATATINNPVVGGDPTASTYTTPTAVTDSDQVTGEVSWTGDFTTDGKFDYDTEYTATVTWTANTEDDFVFDSSSTATPANYKVNGTDGTATTVSYDDSTKTVSMTYTYTTPKKITGVNVTGVGIPDKLGTPDKSSATASANTQIKKSDDNNNVEWSGTLISGGTNDGKFNANTVYTATVIVEPSSTGYVFPDQTTINAEIANYQINGNQVKSATKNADGSVTLVYDFPATAKKAVTAISKGTNDDLKATYNDGDKFEYGAGKAKLTYDNGDVDDDVTVGTRGITVAYINDSNANVALADDTTLSATGAYNGKDLRYIYTPSDDTSDVVDTSGSALASPIIDTLTVANANISEVEVTFAYPASGNTPAAASDAVAGDTSYSITEIAWEEKNPTTGNWSDFNGSTFNYNREYRATVEFTAASTYAFASSVSGTLHDTGSGSDQTDTDDSAETGTTNMTFTFAATAKQKLSSADITIGAPQAAATPKTSATSTTGTTTGTPSWTKSDGSTFTGNFDYNTEYTVEITIKPGDDYEWDGTPTFTIDGESATVKSGPTADGTYTLTYTYPATVKKTAVTTVDVTGVVKPIAKNAATVSGMGVSQSTVTMGTPVWQHDGSTFTGNYQEKETYTISVPVTANAGYRFLGADEDTLSATTATVTDNIDGKHTTDVTFTIDPDDETKGTVTYSYEVASLLITSANTTFTTPLPSQTIPSNWTTGVNTSVYPSSSATLNALTGIVWQNADTTPATIGGLFAENTSYTAVITINAADDYVFDNSYIDNYGATTDEKDISSDGKTLTLKRTITTDVNPVTAIAITGSVNTSKTYQANTDALNTNTPESLDESITAAVLTYKHGSPTNGYGNTDTVARADFDSKNIRITYNEGTPYTTIPSPLTTDQNGKTVHLTYTGTLASDSSTYYVNSASAGTLDVRNLWTVTFKDKDGNDITDGHVQIFNGDTPSETQLSAISTFAAESNYFDHWAIVSGGTTDATYTPRSDTVTQDMVVKIVDQDDHVMGITAVPSITQTSYGVGASLNTEGSSATLEWLYAEHDPTPDNVDDADFASRHIKVVYSDTGSGLTDAQVIALPEVPASLTTAHNNKYLYLVYSDGTYTYADSQHPIGQITVTTAYTLNLSYRNDSNVAQSATIPNLAAGNSVTLAMLEAATTTNRTSRYTGKWENASGTVLTLPYSMPDNDTTTLYAQTKLATPENLSVTKVEYGTSGTIANDEAGGVRVTFDAVDSANSYTLTIKKDGTTVKSGIAVTPAGTYVPADASVFVPGSGYTFEVVAVPASGQHFVNSDAATTTADAGKIRPAVPTNATGQYFYGITLNDLTINGGTSSWAFDSPTTVITRASDNNSRKSATAAATDVYLARTEDITISLTKGDISVTTAPTISETGDLRIGDTVTIDSSSAVAVDANATSHEVSGTFAFTSGTTLTAEGDNTVGYSFTPATADTENYNTASGTITVSDVIQWYTVTLIKNIDDQTTAYYTEQVDKGEKITTTGSTAYADPGLTVNPGYAFDGWFTDATGGTKVDIVNTAITTDTTLYAHWKSTTYAVEFAKNDGTSDTYTSYKISNLNYGSKITNPGTPERTGYTFDGWYKEAAGTTAWDFTNDEVDNNITIYAKWTIKKYTVTFHPNYTGTDQNTNADVADPLKTMTDVEHFTKLAGTDAPTLPDRYGYTNDGKWYTEAACTNEFVLDASNGTEVSGNTDLYLKWTPKNITVNFLYNYDGSPNSGVFVTGTVPFDSAINQNLRALVRNGDDKPSRTNYTFDDWYDGAGDSASKYSLISTAKITSEDTINIYAHWTRNTYSIQFNYNYQRPGGNTAYTKNFTVNAGDSITQTQIDGLDLDEGKTRDGYTFVKWYKQGDTSRTAVDPASLVGTTPTEGTVYFAEWETAPVTVRWLRNDGTTDTVYTASAHYDDSLPTFPANPTRANYNFVRWNLKADNTGDVPTGATRILSYTTEDETNYYDIYAIWEAKSYTVNFKKNDGTSDNHTSVTADYGTKVTRPATDPTRDGYNFDDWYKEATCETKWDFSTDTVTADNMSIYAGWKPVPDASKLSVAANPNPVPAFTSTTLTATYTGESYSGVSYNWYKGTSSVALTDGDKYTISGNTLVIKNFTVDDVATYKAVMCIDDNETIANASASVALSKLNTVLGDSRHTTEFTYSGNALAFTDVIATGAVSVQGEATTLTVASSATTGKEYLNASGISYEWQDKDGVTLSSAPKNAGSYKLVMKLGADSSGHYNTPENKVYDITIKQKELTATAQAFNKDYDGTTALPEQTLKKGSGLTGFIEEEGDDVSLLLKGTYGGKDARDYSDTEITVTTAASDLTDPSGNYKLGGSITLQNTNKISAVAITKTVTGASTTIKVGATQNLNNVGTIQFSGLKNNETLTLDDADGYTVMYTSPTNGGSFAVSSGSMTTAAAAEGTYVFPATILLRGTASQNYTLEDNTYNVTITVSESNVYNLAVTTDIDTTGKTMATGYNKASYNPGTASAAATSLKAGENTSITASPLTGYAVKDIKFTSTEVGSLGTLGDTVGGKSRNYDAPATEPDANTDVPITAVFEPIQVLLSDKSFTQGDGTDEPEVGSAGTYTFDAATAGSDSGYTYEVVGATNCSASLNSATAPTQISITPASADADAVAQVRVTDLNGTIATATYTLPKEKIKKKTLDAVVQNITVTYDGSQHGTASDIITSRSGFDASAPAIVITYTRTLDGNANADGSAGAWADDVVTNGTAAVPVNAGTYTATISVTGNSSYEGFSKTATITINKDTLSAPLDTVINDGNALNTIPAFSGNGTGITSGATVAGTYTVDSAETTVADYDVNANHQYTAVSYTFVPTSDKNKNNYQNVAANNGVVTVQERQSVDSNISFSNVTRTYGTAQADIQTAVANAVITGISDAEKATGSFTYYYKGTSDDGTYDEADWTTTAPYKAGTYQIKADWASNNFTGSKTATLTINKKDLTINWGDILGTAKNFNNNTDVTLGAYTGPTITGYELSDESAVNAAITRAYRWSNANGTANVHAGTKHITGTLSFDTNSTDPAYLNYNIPTASVTHTTEQQSPIQINALQVTPTFANPEKVYNGNKNMPQGWSLAVTDFSGFITGAEPTGVSTTSTQYKDKIVGNAKEIDWHISFTGTYGGDYYVDTETMSKAQGDGGLTGIITQCPIVFSVQNQPLTVKVNTTGVDAANDTADLNNAARYFKVNATGGEVYDEFTKDAEYEVEYLLTNASTTGLALNATDKHNTTKASAEGTATFSITVTLKGNAATNYKFAPSSTTYVSDTQAASVISVQATNTDIRTLTITDEAPTDVTNGTKKVVFGDILNRSSTIIPASFTANRNNSFVLTATPSAVSNPKVAGDTAVWDWNDANGHDVIEWVDNNDGTVTIHPLKVGSVTLKASVAQTAENSAVTETVTIQVVEQEVKVTLSDDVIYNGGAQSPTVTVKGYDVDGNEVTLEEDTDYEVVFHEGSAEGAVIDKTDMVEAGDYYAVLNILNTDYKQTTAPKFTIATASPAVANIEGTPTFGETLTSGEVTHNDGSGNDSFKNTDPLNPVDPTYTYQWYAADTDDTDDEGTAINGATTANLVLDDYNYVGKYIYVKAIGTGNYADNEDDSNRVLISPITLTGDLRATYPDSETKNAVIGTVITADPSLITQLGDITDEVFEENVTYTWYAVNDEGDDTVLGTGKTYTLKAADAGKTVYAVAEYDHHGYKGELTSNSIITAKYELTSSDLSFTDVYQYSAFTKNATVTNAGNYAVTLATKVVNKGAAVTDTENANFTAAIENANIAAGANATVVITPVTGLAVGTYEATVYVYDEAYQSSGAITSFNVTFEVTPLDKTVKFYDEDGTTLIKEQTVTYNNPVTAPTAPAPENYHFVKWVNMADGSDITDAQLANVTEDLSVKAVYAIDTNSVKFYDEDGTTLIEEKTVNYGSPVTPPASEEREGYTMRWVDTTTGDVIDDFSSVTGPITVKRDYKKVTFNITNATAEDAKGTLTIAEKANAGTTVTFVTTPQTGYVLNNVTVTDAEGNTVAVKNSSFTMPESDVTVTATFTTASTGGGGGGGGSVNTLTLHYKNEDGTAGDKVSAISVPLNTAPVDLTGVFKNYIKDKTIIWTSSDEKVATVDENGTVTFVGEGTATITAQSKNTKSLKATANITVTAPTATESPSPTDDPSTPTPTPTSRPVYDKTDSLITKTMLNPYIVGYDDYVFGPELPISREELATIFARLIANNLYMDQDYDTSFPDVPEGWSKSYIGYLEKFNVVTGYEDGDFRPQNYITRAEMAVMMAKAEGYNLDGYVSPDETPFPDVDEGYSTWAATKAIKILTDMGIMEGYTDGTFRPGKPITRAETVATVNRVLADMEVADYEVLPSDVTDAHWAYNDIVFAMNHRVLKDAAADPQRFVWSEQFDENMIINTEKVEGETVQVGEETPEGDAENQEETSDNPDAVAAESKEDTSEGDNAQTTE